MPAVVRRAPDPDMPPRDRPQAPKALSEGLIGWWCKSSDLKVASTRIRGAVVLRALTDRGVPATWFDPRQAQRYRCLVLSKRYDDKTLRVTRAFKARGGRVVVDLCDQHFVVAPGDRKDAARVANLRALVALADAITVSAQPLVQIVARECPDAVAATVIGDMADDLSMQPLPLYRVPSILWKRRREQARVMSVPDGVTRLVWFGNASGRNNRSGMVDLARVVPDIARLAQRFPLHLTVISNSRARYREWIAPAAVAQRYVEWDPWTFEMLLGAQHIALIPAAPNEFTASKSDNRAVSAFRAGLAVVADPIPSYAHFGSAIPDGEFASTLATYLEEPARRAANAESGRIRALASSDPRRLASLWLAAFGSGSRVAADLPCAEENRSPIRKVWGLAN